MNPAVNVAERFSRSDRLLNRWAVEERTSLDITTIYRKMKAGTFPQPARVGRRRVAWRESDIAAWQAALEVGTRL
jgi:prophage regulatory protein